MDISSYRKNLSALFAQISYGQFVNHNCGNVNDRWHREVDNRFGDRGEWALG